MPKQNKYKCIHEHSADLALIINQLGYEDVHNWLMIASGIKKIEFNWNRFDKTDSKEWCRPSYEYDVAKGNVSQLYINELTVFNYVWGGFENLLSKRYSKSQIKKVGKINLCVKEFENFDELLIEDYKVFKERFFLMFNNSLEKNLIEYKKIIPQEEIKIIYNIRNKFAHGDLEFPEDTEYNSQLNSPIDLIKLIRASTRIILCYIQNLILISNRGEFVYSYLNNLFLNVELDDYGDDMFPSEFILRKLHLKELFKNDLSITVEI
ncbi:hypothetical protein [Maribacter forsetii]|uniref:hypothetical protein n=1 Tax=Maribacter forsetii TaxID=444515 RepID=UPI00055E2A1C|nr:hypothetical protein [Maribacter forsetii]